MYGIKLCENSGLLLHSNPYELVTRRILISIKRICKMTIG